MKSVHYFTLLFIVLLLLIAWVWFKYKPQPSIQTGQLDVLAWKHDKNGCKGDRMAQKQNMEAIFAELMHQREAEILQLLGSPDYQDLFQRGQKYYVYRVESNPSCGTNNPNYLRLRIRFDALGRVNEIQFSQQ